MIFHPSTLKELLKFKTTKCLLSVELLSLLIDNVEFISIDELNHILFSYTDKTTNVDKIIKKYFVRDTKALDTTEFTSEQIPVDNFKYICYIKNIPEVYKDIILKNRLKDPKRIGAEGLNIVENLPPRSPNIVLFGYTLKSPKKVSNKLNFLKVAEKIEATDIFKPLILNSTFLYKNPSILVQSIRKRKDLTNPVKFQYIHHYDQKRPPIYRKRNYKSILSNILTNPLYPGYRTGEERPENINSNLQEDEPLLWILQKMKTSPIFSDEKIDSIDYDIDSSEEWEDITEITSEDEIEETEENSFSWIEDDSEDQIIQAKQPVLTFEDVEITEFYAISKYISDSL